MVKLKDIAERTGVTISTVSAALNGRGNMSSETRERLIETARQMGYAPNQAARLLRNKPAVDVALVINDSRHNLRLSGTYLVHISEFLDYCRERDFSQRIEFFTDGERDTAIPETMRDRVARGIIHVGFVTPGLKRFLEELRRTGDSLRTVSDGRRRIPCGRPLGRARREADSRLRRPAAIRLPQADPARGGAGNPGFRADPDRAGTARGDPGE